MKPIAFGLIIAAAMSSASIASAQPEDMTVPAAPPQLPLVPRAGEPTFAPDRRDLRPIVELDWRDIPPSAVVPDLEHELRWGNSPFGWRIPLIIVYEF
jgi:hypothetical protein